MAYQKLNNCSRMLAITKSDINNVPNPAIPTSVASATGAIIVVSGGAITSVTLDTKGFGYDNLGGGTPMTASISGTSGSSATLKPYINTDTSLGINVTAGGSGFTDGTYTSGVASGGVTYTLTITAGTATNNAFPAQPCQLYINVTSPGFVKVLTAGGDDVTVNMPTGSHIVPVQVIRVYSAGTTATATYFGVW